MAPDAKRKRGRPSNASLARGESSNATRRPRDPRQSSGNGRRSDKRQSSLRESWAASTRREAAASDEDEDDDEQQQQQQQQQAESQRSNKRHRASDAPGQGSRAAPGGRDGVIGRRGIPQPNQPGHDRQRPGRRDEDQEADRASSRPSSSSSSAPPSPPKPYVHVASHTRRVRQSAIEAKWSPLADASLKAVASTLQSAQRPIVQRLSDSHLRRTHTASALRLVSHRIARKMARGLPFPPASMPANVGRAPLQSDAGREVELSFESVLDGKLNLERQLGPALDGLHVLQREKENVERELEHDYDTLRGLEADARAQAREQRSLLKKAHVLTPAAPTPPVSKRQRDQSAGAAASSSTAHLWDKDDEFRFVRDESFSSVGAFTHIDDDDEIQPVAEQLSEHVDRIRANLEQTDGILPQLATSRAALRALLLKYLPARLYEQVVLG